MDIRSLSKKRHNVWTKNGFGNGNEAVERCQDKFIKSLLGLDWNTPGVHNQRRNEKTTPNNRIK